MPRLPSRPQVELRVLLVDFDSRYLQTIRAGLEVCGHTVVTAASAAEALALMRRQRVDLIIAGILPAGPQEPQLLHNAWRLPHHHDTPVILLTTIVPEGSGPVEGTYAGKGDSEGIGGAVWILTRPQSPGPLLLLIDEMHGRYDRPGVKLWRQHCREAIQLASTPPA